MSQPLLEFDNVSKEFKIGGVLTRRRISALKSVSFKISSDKPTIVGLVGESGSGKTTLAKLILGLLDPTSGRVLYRGKAISEWLKKDKTTFLREVQPIFQDPYSVYNPFYKVERVMEIVIRKRLALVDEREKQEKILKTMKDIGLRPEDLLGRYPHQLSGGERQRFMLARVLLIRPRLLVADEPVSMIDASLKAIFLNHLISFKEKFDISCLYITHDLNTASYVCDKIFVLCHGRIVEEGPKDAIIKDPLHPYTKLLISSIAIPNPKKRWKDEIDLRSLESLKEIEGYHGCIFAANCPYSKNICKQKEPPFLELEAARSVACFQYSK